MFGPKTQRGFESPSLRHPPPSSVIPRFAGIGESRVPGIGAREPRQIRKEATVVGNFKALGCPALTRPGDGGRATNMIDKLTIATVHTDAMAGFYTSVLCASFTAQTVGSERLWTGFVGPLELWLVPRHLANIHARDNVVQVRFVVADLDEAMRAAPLHGGSVVGEALPIADLRLGAVRDPDGNVIELIQRGSQAKPPNHGS
jgi:predicted enzyme related to lactoylglutathione lyase